MTVKKKMKLFKLLEEGFPLMDALYEADISYKEYRAEREALNGFGIHVDNLRAIHFTGKARPAPTRIHN